MALQTITYKYNGIEHTKNLAAVVDKKFEALNKFIPAEATVACTVEFEKAADHVHGRIYRVKANLTIDGTLFRAEATEETFERAIDEVRDELDKELRRVKDKQGTTARRAGRLLKRILRRG